MFQNLRVGAIILIGGEGTRFGSRVPKQFLKLGDRAVYRHAVQAFIQCGLFDELVLACHPEWVERVSEETGLKTVAGGASRQESVWLGLHGFEMRPDVVAIHDGVRPFVSEEILRANVEGAVRWGAVDTCIPSADTLVYAPGTAKIEAIPNRRDYLRGQTPQTFRFDWIWEAHQAARTAGIIEATDDCQLLLRMGKEVHIVQGSEKNLKITSETDLLIANQMAQEYICK